MSEQYPAQAEPQRVAPKITPFTICALIFLLLTLVITILKIYSAFRQPHPLLIFGIVLGRLLGFALLFAPVSFLLWRFALGRKRGAGLLSFSLIALVVTLLLPV